ncbi:MAG: transglutaminase-like domain-containing protein, partial [Pseudomonadota bacterium]
HPKASRQFEELGKDFIARYRDPAARAEAIEKYLSTRFEYTRSEYWKVPRGKTPVDAFLFDWKKGNCEYFSTSMVLLLRAGGIPARNVAGFLGGQWNKIGNYLIIREGDAHSWVEAYFPDHGWVIFDPTPASGSPEFITSPYLSAVLQFFDIISLGWQKHVIAYDLSHQSKFLRASYGKFMQYRREMGSLGSKAEYRFGPAQKRLLIVLSMLVFWTLYFLYFRKEQLMRTPQAYRQSVSARKAVNLMSELDRRLEVLGLYRPLSRPPLKHSHRISSHVNDSGTLFEIVDIYNETRFGHKMLETTQYKTMVQRIRALE